MTNKKLISCGPQPIFDEYDDSLYPWGMTEDEIEEWNAC